MIYVLSRRASVSRDERDTQLSIPPKAAPVGGLNRPQRRPTTVSGNQNYISRAGSGTPCEDDGWHAEYSCANGHIRHVRHHCHNPLCPRCARAWALKSASRIAARVDGIAAMTRRYARHWVLSPPPAMWGYLETLDLRELRAMGVRYALDLGLHGGDIVAHGWREEHRGWGDWYWSPHFHVLAWGTISPGPQARISALSNDNAPWRGWRAKCVSKVTDHGNLSAQGVARSIIAYELDHCALQVGVQVHLWYGSCSSRALRVIYQVRREPSCCVHCGAVEYVVVDGEPHQVTHLELYAQVQRRAGHRKRTQRRKWGGVRAVTRLR